ncbi:FtsK/SpoIIIE domain-containing protein [Actinomadura viridis]|uniref:FtsK/SpoIIIE domain-containing protein n=1 Tax=Actinomadura viridis TaxID=58110 RepID=UPI0036AA8E33
MPAVITAVLGPALAALNDRPSLALAIGAAAGGLAILATAAWAHQSAGRADGINPWRPISLALLVLTIADAMFCAARGTPSDAWIVVISMTPVLLLAIARAVQIDLRRRTQRRLTTYLAAELGIRSTAGEPADLLRMQRWRGWQGGLRPRPRAGFITPPPGVDETSPELLAVIRKVFIQRAGVYVVMRPDSRRDRITFRASTEPEVEPEDPQLLRLRQVVESLGRALPDPKVEILARAQDDPAAMASAVEVFAITAFRVTHAPTPQLGNPNVRSVVCAELGQMLYGDPNCLSAEWRRHADQVDFRVRPELPAQIPNPVLDAEQIAEQFGSELVLPLGVDEYGELVGWQLTRTTRPHGLIVGPTGGGKTVAILGLALAAARAGCEVRGVDPKYIELRGLRGWPSVSMLATGRSVPKMVEIVEDTFAEMHHRYDQIDRGLANEDDFQRILLILDEYYVFVEQCNSWWKANRPAGDRRTTHPVIDTVGELAAMARGASIHLLLGVQRPDSAHFPAGARDNFRFRVSLAELSPEGNRMMWEREARELPRIPAELPGRAIVSSSQRPRLAQVFWTPNPAKFPELSDADRALVQAMVPPGTTWSGPRQSEGALLSKTVTADASVEQTASTPADRLLTLLTLALRSRTAHLTSAADGGPPHPGAALQNGPYGWSTGPDGQPEPAGTWIGCVTAGPSEADSQARIYLLPATAVDVARQVAAAIGQPFTTPRTGIDDALDAANLVVTEEEAGQVRRTVRRTLPGAGRFRVWDIPAKALLANSGNPQPPQEPSTPADAKEDTSNKLN